MLWEKVGRFSGICRIKKQLIWVTYLCLTFGIVIGSVGIAAPEQICQTAGRPKLPVTAMADKCCAEQKAKQPVAAKTKLDKKCCLFRRSLISWKRQPLKSFLWLKYYFLTVSK